MAPGEGTATASLKNFTNLGDAPSWSSLSHYEWMPLGEESALGRFKANISSVVLFYTFVWFVIHGVSMLISASFLHSLGVSKKDVFRWHNKAISMLHAAVAFAQGVWWISCSGELKQLDGRVFGFFPSNASIAAIGAAYFVYDFLFCSLSSFYVTDKQLPVILVHHAIFMCAYYSTLVYPCVLSVSTYHYFQLTELSTVLLHLVWMLSKTRASYPHLRRATFALLATFLQRVVTTAFIVRHVIAFIIKQELWQVQLPHGLSKYTTPYITYFVICSISMLVMNTTWLFMLVSRARDMIKRVQNGQAPSPDYERRTQKAD